MSDFEDWWRVTGEDLFIERDEGCFPLDKAVAKSIWDEAYEAGREKERELSRS